MAKVLRVIQITDMHIQDTDNKQLLGVDTRQSLEAVLEMIDQNEKQIDAIILTGDLSHDGSESSYSYLAQKFKAFNVPIYSLPGNHDNANTLMRMYKTGPIVYQPHALHQDWQFLFLNSQIPGAVEGYLDEPQLDFLQSALQKNSKQHAIVFFHHHPLPVGSQWLDKLGLKNANAFWETIKNDKKLKAIVFGHVHQEFNGEWEGLDCYGTPSTCIQFQPKQNQFALDSLPPGYRAFNLYPDGQIETKVYRCPQYVGVFDKEAKGY